MCVVCMLCTSDYTRHKAQSSRTKGMLLILSMWILAKGTWVSVSPLSRYFYSRRTCARTNGQRQKKTKGPFCDMLSQHLSYYHRLVVFLLHLMQYNELGLKSLYSANFKIQNSIMIKNVAILALLTYSWKLHVSLAISLNCNCY